MFSRRTIQTILDGLGRSLPLADLNEIVARLNRPRDRIAATWEATILYGLSRAGTVSHHLPLPDGRKPDVVFSLPGQQQIEFVADVTTISDAGHHRANPLNGFLDEFARIVRKAGLNPSHFHCQVDSATAGSKIKLLLPRQTAQLAKFKIQILPFLRELKKHGHQNGTLRLSEPDLAITIRYDRHQRYMGAGYRTYTQARVLEQNPLWNSLQDKADQLKSARGLNAGIIVCDGGCSLLTSSLRDPGSFSADDIVRRFLGKRSSIAFVYLITARRGYGANAECRFEMRGWVRDPIHASKIDAIINRALSSLPNPLFDSQNAAIQAQQTGYGVGMRGAMEIGMGDKIVRARIPARTLLELLAGRLSASEIDLAFGGSIEPDIPGLPNPFQLAIAEGRMISEIQLEPAEGKDDDWITIRFGDPDPAISPFRVSPNCEERGS